MRQIHTSVEQNRGAAIPDWAYRDVLFMLIHYSIAAYELLEKKLTDDEKEEVYNVFYRVGIRMGLKGLPISYIDWLPVRKEHLIKNLQKSELSEDLFRQYKKHLGNIRFRMLIEGQKLVVPESVKQLLNLSDFSLLTPVLPMYKMSRTMRLDGLINNLLLPSDYKEHIKQLDVNSDQ